MPVEDTIGSHGLEQGGPNLGDDYRRPIHVAEQNQTTNPGPHPSEKKNKDEENNTDAAAEQAPHFVTTERDEQ